MRQFFQLLALDVRHGSEASGFHVDIQITFHVENQKAVTHFYNTMKLVMINGKLPGL